MKLIGFYVNSDGKTSTTIIQVADPNQTFEFLKRERENLIKEYDFLAIKDESVGAAIYLRMLVEGEHKIVSSNQEELEKWKKSVSK